MTYNKEKFIIETARMLYSKLSERKRKAFLKWELKNNWDVKEIFTYCIIEAQFMWDELTRNQKHFN